MSPELWDRAKQVFEVAITWPLEERSAQLDRICGSDDELRRVIVQLLAGHDEPSSLLDKPAADHTIFSLSQLAAPAVKADDVLAGRFEIIRLIGSGGMGDVYLARDLDLEGDDECDDVAIKTIRPHKVWDTRLETLFRHEVELARKVTHPNVCRIHEFFIHKNPSVHETPGARLPFFSMEFLPGNSLKETLRLKRFEYKEAISVLTQLASGLSAAHSAGVLHGDYKPANIVLVEQESGSRAVITDFGLAKSLKPSLQAGQGKALGGTPQYMAPELRAGRAPSFASDVFAFGVVAAEVLSGVDGNIDEQVLARNVSHLPPRVRKVIVKCTHREPELRFSDAGKVHDAWVQATAPRSSALPRLRFVYTAAAGLAGFLVAREFGYFKSSFGKPAIAVLPIRAGSRDLEPLADGLADYLIASLARTPQVRVIARSSSFLYKEGSGDVLGFAKRLAADFLVTAQIWTEEGRYRLTAQLTRSADGSQVWRESFAADANAIYEIQQKISVALHQQFQTGYAKPSRPAPDPKAHELYLAGRYLWNKRDPESLMKALDSFRAAVEISPQYADAWAGVSMSYQLLASSQIPLAEAGARAREAANRALQSDDQLAEAHLCAGLLSQRFEWRWEDAIRSFRRAIELEPGNERAHHWYAGLLSDLGFADAAMSEIELARALSPLSFAVDTAAAMYLYVARRYDEAIARAKRVIAIEPSYFRIYPFIAACQLEMRRPSEAIEHYERAYNLAPTDPYVQAHLAYAYFRTGQRARAEPLMHSLLNRKVPPPPFYVALAYCGDHASEDALKWLQRGYDEHDPSMSMVKVYPALDPIRAERQYQDLLGKMRFNSASSVRV